MTVVDTGIHALAGLGRVGVTSIADDEDSLLLMESTSDLLANFGF
jgi:uncharacterized protein (UPF0254 family)